MYNKYIDICYRLVRHYSSVAIFQNTKSMPRGINFYFNRCFDVQFLNVEWITRPNTGQRGNIEVFFH